MPTDLPLHLALAGGSFIFLGVIVILFFAVVFGFFTRTGSGIDHHPTDGRGEAPGSGGPSEASGKGRTSSAGDERMSSGGTFSTHGTG